MDIKVLFLFALLAAVLVNADDLPGIPTLGDIQTKAEDEVKKLVTLADQVTTTGTSAATEMAQKLRENTQARMLDAEAVVNKTVTELKDSLVNEVQKAGGSVDKILQCTQMAQSALDTFRNQTLEKLTDCLTERVEKAAGVMTPILQATQDVATIMSEVQTNIEKDCPANNSTIIDVGQTLCTLSLIFQAEEKIAAQALIISNKVIDGSTFITNLDTLQTDLTDCFATKTASAVLDSVPIITNIVTCTTTLL